LVLVVFAVVSIVGILGYVLESPRALAVADRHILDSSSLRSIRLG